MAAISSVGFSKSLARKISRKITQGFTFLTCLVVALQPMMVELAYAQEIIIDPNGNVGFAPTMQRTSRPQVVDIARPNSGGVSHNQYTEFNVPNEGAVLNNSQGATNTRVAGTISGNPNLSGGTASTIVNEVTSTSSSILTGSIEVAGDRAGVIIANPNGILCNGCNFLNASNGTLTTGVPVINGSNVQLDVTQGTVTIGRRGLRGDAGFRGAISDVNLIGRTVVIDGKVTAINGINVQGGAQSYDLTNQRRVSTLTGTGTTPDLVVDGTEYGAMEAGRIQIIGNERGLGVRTLGAVQSSTDGVRIVSEGDATVRSVAAQGRADLRANYGNLTIERDVSSAGADTLAYARYDVNTTDRTGLYGLTGVTVTSQNRTLSFSGVVQSGADVTLYGRKQLTFSAYGSATGDFTLRGVNGVTVEDATIVANRVIANEGGTSFTLSDSAIFSAENFNITTGDFHLGENVVVDGLTESDVSNLVVTASGDFHNSADLRRHDAATITYAGNLYNEVGGVIEEDTLRIAFDREVHNSGILYGVTSLDFDVAALFNNETGVILSDRVDINTTGLLSNAGTISSDGDIFLTSGTKIVNDGYVQGIRAYLTAPEIKNGGGAELRVRDYGRITASTDFTNQGILASTASFQINAGRFENKGLISVETNLSVIADTIINRDALTAGNSISLRATGALKNLGTIASYYNATLASDSIVENQGTILADNALSISGPWFDNKGVDALVRAKAGNINTANIRNSGSVFLINDFRRRGNIDFFDNDGVFASQGRIEIKGRDANSRIILRAGSALIAGLQADDATQELLLGSSVTLSAIREFKLDGRIAAGGSVNLSGPSHLYLNGVVEARQNLYLTASRITASEAATAQAEGAGFINAASLFTNYGTLSLGSYLDTRWQSGSFINHGLIAADRLNLSIRNNTLQNTGVMTATSAVSVVASSITNQGHLQAGANLSLNAQQYTSEPYIDSNGNERLRWIAAERGGISNTGTLSSGAYTFLTGHNVRLNTGTYLAAEQLRVTANSFHMRGSAALTGANRNDWNIAEDYRQYGTLFSEGALRIYAGSYQSYADSLLGSSDYVTLNVTNAANLGGSLIADRVTLTASTIAGSDTSSVFASDDLRLTASNGKVSHLGELIAGEDLYVTSNEFDIRGNAFAKRVHLDGVIRGYTRGNLYGSETVTVDVSDGGYYNYGLAEARDKLTIGATSISNYAGAQLSSTEIDARATNGISNAGELFGASKITLNAGSSITNQATGKITAVSLGLTSGANFTNYGELDLYGFFGDVTGTTQNFGTIATETYFGLDTTNFYNRTGATLTSGDHLYIKASNLISNYETARIEATTVDLRAGYVSNSGAIEGAEVVNIADLTGTFKNNATGTIHAKAISLFAGSSFRNDGRIGQRGSNSLPKADTVYISAGTSATNYGRIEATNLSLLAQSSIVNYDLLKAHSGTLALKSETSYVTNLGEMRARDIVVESGGTFDNRSTFKASETITVSAGGDIRNRSLDGSYADTGAKVIVLHAAGAISNNAGSRLFGYQSLGVQADGGNIQNDGTITGPDITLIAQNGGVYSTAGIYAGGTLAIEARNIGLRGRVSVTDQVSLKSTLYDVEVNQRIDTKRLLVDAARYIESNGAAFRGTELTQLIARDIRRMDGNFRDDGSSRKLSIIGGALTDVYVQIKDGNLGIVRDSIYNSTGHDYERVYWDVAGSVSIIVEGNALLSGKIHAANDVYIRSDKQSTLLSNINLYAGKTLHAEGHKLLKNYGGVTFDAGRKVQLIQNDGWFYTADWLKGETLNYDLTAMARTIIVNSSHRFRNRDLVLRASDSIRQWHSVISARKVTYSAGKNIKITFNPFEWRSRNPGAVATSDWWDVPTAGLRGHTLIAQSRGLHVYAGNDLTFRSGKVHSYGDMTLVAGRNFLSEPIYIETGRTNRPGNVGWSFSNKYSGVISGHDASKVTIKELRAYENQITAKGSINILAGGSASFIGTYLQSREGDITIEALNGGVNMVAAPGYWSYDYRVTTVKKKLFGFYKKRTTYEFDALEDIYKRSKLQAANGDITITATGDNGDYASILSAGTSFNAQNIRISTPNGNVSAGTYAERSIEHTAVHSSTSIFWVIPFGSSDVETANNILVNYGNDFLADELLDIAAPSGTLSITGGSIRARTVNLTAARLEINAAINSTRESYYSRKDNMITITTIQSGFDRETAHLPEIYAPNINFNISGETHIQGAEGATLNNQLINLIGSRTFDNATLGLASPEDLANAGDAAQEIDQQYIRSYDLPGASDGQQFAYLDTLIQDYGATYHTIELRDHEWYDKQVQLNPAFKALLQAVATYITGGINFGIENAFISAGVEAATTNLIVGVVEGSITGELDMDDILRGALLAGASATISSYLSDQINWGAGLSDQSPFLNDVRGNLAPAAIVDRLGDRVINQVVSNVVHGQDPFEGFDDLGRTFLVSETLALAQFGIGELGNGQGSNWEGSVGHLILHGGVGCLALEALNGDCVAGFFAGASSSLLAGSNLSDEQILELAPLVGAFAGYFTSGGNAINVSFGGTISQSAVVNNFLTHVDIENFHAELRACEQANEAASGSCNVNEIAARYRELSDQRNADLQEALRTGDTTFLQWAIANTATGVLISDLGPTLSIENGQLFSDIIEEGRTGLTYNGQTFNYVGEIAFEALKDIALETGDTELLLEASLNYLGPSGFAPNIGPLLGRGFHAVMVGGQLRVRGPTGRVYSEPSQLPYSAIRDGAARAQQFGSNWSRASLSDAIQNFAGPNYRMHRTATGKEIYENPTTGVQVVYDTSGQYFRIHNPNLTGRRTYLDLNGTVPNNRINADGTQSGRTQGEYNAVTHFLAD